MQPQNMSDDLVYVTQMAELGRQHGEKTEAFFISLQKEVESVKAPANLKNVSSVYEEAGHAAYTESLKNAMNKECKNALVSLFTVALLNEKSKNR